MPTTFCLKASTVWRKVLTSYYSKVLNKRAARIIIILDFVQPTQLFGTTYQYLRTPTKKYRIYLSYKFYFHDFFLRTHLFGTLG